MSIYTLMRITLWNVATAIVFNIRKYKMAFKICNYITKTFIEYINVWHLRVQFAYIDPRLINGLLKIYTNDISLEL